MSRGVFWIPCEVRNETRMVIMACVKLTHGLYTR